MVHAADAQLVRVVDDRHQQAVVDRHGDPDVHLLLEDDAILGELAVQGRVLAQRLGGSLDDRGDIADADPLARLVGLLVRLSPAHDVVHVHLHDRVRVGDRLLDAGHLGRDPLAHLA